MKKRIAVYFTGGTIAMTGDPSANPVTPMLSGEELLKSVPVIRELSDVHVIDFGCIPGTHMSLPLMMRLAGEIRETLADDKIDGVVVTHGTDTLEETAYLVDLVVASQKPIAFVGAMNSRYTDDWDGYANLAAAICVAASPVARGLGTVAVMNGKVFAAREVTKAHTISLDAFESPDQGPLGTVKDLQVEIQRRPTPQSHIAGSSPVEPVWLIKVAVGYDSTLINSCIDQGAKGIVIEGLGCGNISPGCVPGIETAIAAGIPVVMTSRCFRGPVVGRYTYVGGGAHLRQLGVIFADTLSAQKARIKLSLALGAAKSQAEIRQIFELN
jgi:L-asparaginase